MEKTNYHYKLNKVTLFKQFKNISNKCDTGITYKLTEIIVCTKLIFCINLFFYPTHSALYYSTAGRGVL